MKEKKEKQRIQKFSRKVITTRRWNRNIFYIIYGFIVLFLFLIGNFIYFMVVKRPEVINNSYNKRQDLLSERFIRGTIYDRKKEILAQTITDSEGKEIREYPYGEVFAHTIGRFEQGKTGLELIENFNLLTSHINIISQTNMELKGEKIPADNVVTTLDMELSKIAYDALGNKKGAIIVLEPKTGKVLVMVSKPSYNPNTVFFDWESLNHDEKNDTVFLNRATQGLYPPGSTFKIVTLLEYIRENKDYKNYTYTCIGKDRFGDRDIQCYNREAHGTVNLKQSLAKSCNCSFAHIGTLLNQSDYMDTAQQLGFNHKPEFCLPSKTSHFSITKESSLNEIAQTAMGQGKTQITPYQNALIVSAVANKGISMKPYLTQQIETSGGSVVRKAKPQKVARFMTEEEASVLKDCMKQVVDKGTANGLQSEVYQAAGKTGSAEYDSTGASHAWFIGFAPVEDPQIAVSIIVESSGTGSQYAVPVAKKIFNAFFLKK